LFFGPRLAFLIYWIIAPVRVRASFDAFNLPILVGILGLVFAPFFTLMYVLVFPLNGYDWFWLGLALAIDVAGYIGGDRNRHKVPGYSNMMPGDVPPSSAPPPAAMAAPMAAPMSAPMAAPTSPPAPPAADAMPPSAPASDEGEEK
jgi:hypothetical protein